MALSTWCQVQGRDEGAAARRAQGQGKMVGDRREEGKENDWPRMRAGGVRGGRDPTREGRGRSALPLPQLLAQTLLTSSTIFLPWGTMFRKLWITWSCSMGRGLVFPGAALREGGRSVISALGWPCW